MPVKIRVRILSHDAEMPKAKILKKLEISRFHDSRYIHVISQRRSLIIRRPRCIHVISQRRSLIIRRLAPRSNPDSAQVGQILWAFYSCLLKNWRLVCKYYGGVGGLNTACQAYRAESDTYSQHCLRPGPIFSCDFFVSRLVYDLVYRLSNIQSRYTVEQYSSPSLWQIGGAVSYPFAEQRAKFTYTFQY